MGYRDQEMRVVSVNDPAIDALSMTIDEMVEYRDKRDIKLIERFVRPGEKPAIFHITEVPRKIWTRYVMSAGTEAERFERCFLAGVRRVENLRQDDGTTMPVYELPREQNSLAAREETLDRFWPSDVLEIGAVVWAHSFLAPGTRRSYPLPLMCLEALAAREFRRAAASPTSRATSSETASSTSVADNPETRGATVKSNETSASSSASPTDATAAATQ